MDAIPPLVPECKQVLARGTGAVSVLNTTESQIANPATPAPEWHPRHNPWLIALTVTLATFMEVLDTSIANVALPHIAGGLSATEDEATWVLTSYLVSNAMILPISGWLSVLFGRKRFYMTCVALFTISSFLCGLAPTLPILILLRILQGAGGGGLGPSEQAILADTFPGEKRGPAFALYGMAVVVAPAIGPTLGGWITDNFSWRWIFYINVPVGIISLLLTQRMVEDPDYMKQMRKRKLPIDWTGLALIIAGIGCLQIVLDKGQEDDWFSSPFITTFLVIAIIAIAIFIFWEWRQPEPVVDLRLFKNRNFAVSASLLFVMGLALFSTTVLIPQFLQTLLGYSAETAGEALSVGGLTMFVLMPVAGRFVTRMDPRYMIAFGFGITAVAVFHMTNISTGVDFHTAMMWRIYQTIGLPFIFIPNSTLAYVGVPQEKNNQVSGMNNLMRNVGGSIGVSLVTTFLARHSQVHMQNLIAHATPYDSSFRDMLNGMTQALIRAGMSAADAEHQAYARVYGLIQRQAATLAYVNVIWILGIALALLVPLPFLMKRPPKGGKTELAVH